MVQVRQNHSLGDAMNNSGVQVLSKKEERFGLHNMIETRQAKVGIIGLGYVGLPLAVEFAESGFAVTGFEVDPRKIESLLAGESYIADIPPPQVRAVVDKK